MAEIRAVVGEEAFSRSLSRSLGYTAVSVALTVASAIVAWQLIPMSVAWMPAWIAYAIVAGTFGCGVWIIGHECGHGAFCDNDKVQNTIGFVLHSALLVPYFSWQRSHAVHHAKTNHIDEGETHVPHRATTASGKRLLAARRRIGGTIFASWTIFSRLVFGWPLYLLVGLTGGPSRGRTNHFWPYAPFASALFPARWAKRVLVSTLGVATMVVLLVAWAYAAGSVWPVVALYIGPYLVVNAWLVTYTWLQHTSRAIPHYGSDSWSYVLGAFGSVDRPYGPVFNFLHHRIGSTHVVHHLFPSIPHYNAREATIKLRRAYPHLYRWDPTPVPAAMWHAARDCVAVNQENGRDIWRFSLLDDS